MDKPVVTQKGEVNQMDEILSFLLEYASDLYKKYGFKFTDSKVSEEFGGENGYIQLSNDELDISISNDRSQMFIEFFPRIKNQKRYGYSLGLLREHLTGERFSDVLTENQNNLFLKNNLNSILNCFSKKVLAKNILSLEELLRRRDQSRWRNSGDTNLNSRKTKKK
jgi:hypothetical protein